MLLIACRQEPVKKINPVIKYFFYPDLGDLRGVSLGDEMNLLQLEKEKVFKKDSLGVCLMESPAGLVEVETCFLAPHQKVEAIYSIIYFDSYSEALRTYKELVKFFWNKYKQAPFGSFGENKWNIEKRNLQIKLMLLNEEPTILLNFYRD